MKRITLIVIGFAIFAMSCQTQESESATNFPSETPSQAGAEHNLYLQEILNYFGENPDVMTRASGTAEDFIKQMASVQTAALKNQNFRNMSTAQINAFVRNCVDVSVDPAIIAAVESSLTTKGFSIIPEMNRDAPLTAAVKGYMEEVERLETANDSDAVFKSKMQKAYLTWYRAADDDDDRKLIADSYNVFLGSWEYWTDNGRAWEIGLKSTRTIKSFLKKLVIADVKATAWACWKAKIYALVFWKAMLAAGASGSAYAAIRYLVFYEIIFHASADGMGYYRIGNQMFTVEEVKNMLCREIARQNPELNLSVE